MRVEDRYIAATVRRYDPDRLYGKEQDFRRAGVKVFSPFRKFQK